MLSLIKWNDKYGPWLFYIGFGLVMLSFNFLWISDEAPSTISEMQRVASLMGKFLLYLRVLLMSSRHPRLVIGYFVFRLYVAFPIAAGGDQIINLSALAITASCDTNVRVTLRIYASIFLFFIVTAFSLYFLGWTEDIQRHRWGMTGHSWGLNNPGLFSITLLSLTMAGLLLFETRSAFQNRRGHLLTGNYLLFFSTFLMAVLTFVMTMRLSEPICLLLLPLVYLLFQQKPALMRWLWLMPLACLLISVFLAWWYGPGYGTTTFESRFSIARMIYDRYGLTLLGQDCGLVGFRAAWKNNIPPLALDNSYLRLFLLNGMIIGSVVLTVWSFILFRIGRMKNSLLASFGVVISLWAIMESVVFSVQDNLLLFYLLVPYATKTPVKFPFYASIGDKKMALAVSLPTIAMLIYLYAPDISNCFISARSTQPKLEWHNGLPSSIGSIPSPAGFIRYEGKDARYATFVRNLPLLPADSILRYYDGSPNDSLARFNYRRIALPLLKQSEQCADVCMRLRAEYLFTTRQFFDIRFSDTRHHVLRYNFGNNHPALNRYLKRVFEVANTESMKASMPVRKLADIQPGDVFLYDAKSRPSSQYGHAMMVADVAVHPTTGRKAILLLEGSTPATNIHLVKNLADPSHSPWFFLEDSTSTTKPDGASKMLNFGVASYHTDELYYFE
jgi:hypothetical protein